MQEYFYHLFGLKVVSEMELPEPEPWLCGSPDEADVRIELGPLPKNVQRVIDEAGSKWIGLIDETDFWFASPGGHYYITDGTRILVDTKTALNVLNTRVFLLGSAFGMLLIQRGLMPVHGGSVLRGGHAVIIGGDTGAGKSTVTSAVLKHAGVRFLADDVSALEVGSDAIFVRPAYPQRKLCRDAALAQGYDLTTLHSLKEQAGERDKFAIRSAEDWCGEPAPLGAIVEIVPDKEAKDVTLERVSGHDSLNLVVRNLYRHFVHFMQGTPPERMKKCLLIASKTPVYQLRRPAVGDHVGAMTEQILALL